MRVVEFDEKYRSSLAIMLDKFFTEVEPDRKDVLKQDIVRCNTAIDRIKDSHSIYILLTPHSIPIGFMTCYLNDEHGMVDPYIVCEYQFIEADYRSGKAIATMTQSLAELCVKLQLPIVNTTYINASSTGNLKRLDAEPFAVVSTISLDQATKIYKKYTRRIKK